MATERIASCRPTHSDVIAGLVPAIHEHNRRPLWSWILGTSNCRIYAAFSGFQSVWFLLMALSMTICFRMAATMATLKGFPAARRRL